MPDAARHPPPPNATPDLGALLRQRLERDYARLRAAVHGVGRKRGLRDVAALDDLLGEVVKQVLEQAHKYDPARSAVPWAMGFVPHILLQRGAEQQRRRRVVPASDLGWESDDRLFDALDRAGRAPKEHLEVHRWLEQLGKTDREILRRRYFDGLTGAALAVAVGVSSHAARARLTRALQRLRKIAHAEGGPA